MDESVSEGHQLDPRVNLLLALRHPPLSFCFLRCLLRVLYSRHLNVLALTLEDSKSDSALGTLSPPCGLSLTPAPSVFGWLGPSPFLSLSLSRMSDKRADSGLPCLPPRSVLGLQSSGGG